MSTWKSNFLQNHRSSRTRPKRVVLQYAPSRTSFAEPLRWCNRVRVLRLYLKMLGFQALSLRVKILLISFNHPLPLEPWKYHRSRCVKPAYNYASETFNFHWWPILQHHLQILWSEFQKKVVQTSSHFSLWVHHATLCIDARYVCCNPHTHKGLLYVMRILPQNLKSYLLDIGLARNPLRIGWNTLVIFTF